MITLGQLNGKNVLFYKELTFDFDYRGLTVIYGANTNAGDGSSNGAGKSMALRMLPKVLRLGMPVEQPGNRKSPMFRDGTSISLALKDESATYVVTESQKGKTGAAKVTLEVQGDDRLVRTVALVEKQIEAIFPITEEEFYTCVYLDSRRLAEFQLGSAAKRFAFFTNLFQLNRFDNVRTLINKMIADARDDKVRYETLTTQIEELQTAIKGRDGAAMEKRAQVLALEIEVHQRAAQDGDRLQAALRLIDLEDLAYVIKALKITDKDPLSLERMKEAELRASLMVADIDQTLGSARDWARYLPKKEAWDRAMIPFKSYRPEEYEGADIESTLLELEGQLNSLQREWRSLGSKTEVAGRKEWTNELRISQDTVVVECRSRLGTLKTEVADIDFLLEHSAEDADCPMCGTAGVSIEKYLTDRRTALIEERDILLDKGRKAQALVDEIGEFLQYKEWKVKVDALKVQIDALIEKIEPLQIKRKDYQAWKDVADEEPTVPDSKQPTADTAELEERKGKLSGLRSKLQFLIRANQELDLVLGTLGLELKQEAVEFHKVEHQKSQSALATALTERRQLDLDLGLLKTDAAKLATLTEQRSGINLDDAIILPELYYCYSDKGLKNLAISMLVERLEDRMNRWQHLVFREAFRFKFVVTENEFSILAQRSSLESDIRELSGAESRAFSYLFPLACLPSIPAQRRVNVMILDEPEVNLDEVGKELFITQFLPQLLTVIPHVIIATPLKTEFPNARKFQAKKVGNVTTLEPLTSS